MNCKTFLSCSFCCLTIFLHSPSGCAPLGHSYAGISGIVLVPVLQVLLDILYFALYLQVIYITPFAINALDCYPDILMLILHGYPVDSDITKHLMLAIILLYV